MEHRSRCPIVDEVPRKPGEAELYGACINGKPQRTLAANVSDGGERKSGAGCCAADGRSAAVGKASDHGRGQGLRHARIRKGTPGDEHHPARGAEHDQSQKCGGSADHTACGVRGESAEEKTSRAIVRVDEDGWDAKKSEVARNREGRVAIYLHRSRLQLVPIAKPDGQSVKEVSTRIRIGNRSEYRPTAERDVRLNL